MTGVPNCSPASLHDGESVGGRLVEQRLGRVLCDLRRLLEDERLVHDLAPLIARGLLHGAHEVVRAALRVDEEHAVGRVLARREGGVGREGAEREEEDAEDEPLVAPQHLEPVSELAAGLRPRRLRWRRGRSGRRRRGRRQRRSAAPARGRSSPRQRAGCRCGNRGSRRSREGPARPSRRRSAPPEARRSRSGSTLRSASARTRSPRRRRRGRRRTRRRSGSFGTVGRDETGKESVGPAYAGKGAAGVSSGAERHTSEGANKDPARPLATRLGGWNGAPG